MHVCLSRLVLLFSNRPAGRSGKSKELGARRLRGPGLDGSAKDLEGAACASAAVMGTQALG